MADRPIPTIQRVWLKDYRSIDSCNVELKQISVIVGPNASGKTNFISSILFLSQAVSAGVYSALESSGGLDSILRRSPEQRKTFQIGLESRVRWGSNPSQWPTALYSLEIGKPVGYSVRPFEILHESCELHDGARSWNYRAHRGMVHGSEINSHITIPPDNLYLPIAARTSIFGPLLAALSGAVLYDDFRSMEPRDQGRIGGQVLESNGSNLANVLADIIEVRPDLADRINSYLHAISQEVIGVTTMMINDAPTVVLQQRVGRSDDAVEFPPRAVSAGIWSAIGVLAALFQLPAVDGRLTLIAMEEPGTSLHSAAAGVLFDALTEASEHVQVLVTNHSPELLDRRDLDLAAVIPVRMVSGVTRIGAIEATARNIVQDGLFTVGELMRNDQLSPRSDGFDDDLDSGD